MNSSVLSLLTRQLKPAESDLTLGKMIQDHLCQIGYLISLAIIELLQFTSKQWHNVFILHLIPTYMSKYK